MTHATHATPHRVLTTERPAASAPDPRAPARLQRRALLVAVLVWAIAPAGLLLPWPVALGGALCTTLLATTALMLRRGAALSAALALALLAPSGAGCLLLSQPDAPAGIAAVLGLTAAVLGGLLWTLLAPRTGRAALLAPVVTGAVLSYGEWTGTRVTDALAVLLGSALGTIVLAHVHWALPVLPRRHGEGQVWRAGLSLHTELWRVMLGALIAEPPDGALGPRTLGDRP